MKHQKWILIVFANQNIDISENLKNIPGLYFLQGKMLTEHRHRPCKLDNENAEFIIRHLHPPPPPTILIFNYDKSTSSKFKVHCAAADIRENISTS